VLVVMAMPSTTKSGRNNNFRRNISKVKPFLRKQGIAIEAQGTSVVGTDGELEN
jgi:hypothetical protein